VALTMGDSWDPKVKGCLATLPGRRRGQAVGVQLQLVSEQGAKGPIWAA